MDWYPTLATFAGIKVPEGRVIDGRDLVPCFRRIKFVRPALKNYQMLCPCAAPGIRQPNGFHPAPRIRRGLFLSWQPRLTGRRRWRNWKLYLNPSLQLYDLVKDPGETQLVRNAIARKLRGMAICFSMKCAQTPARRRVALRPDGLANSAQHVNQLNTQRDVTYAHYGDRTLEMDIYRPKGEWGALPAVVCIHGGGWAKGDRTSHAKIAQALAARGYVAAFASPMTRGEAPFPAQIYDCKAAVRFLRANAAYGINPDQSVHGLSAGSLSHRPASYIRGVQELEGNGGHAQFSSTIQAAVPMGARPICASDRTREISAIEARGKSGGNFWRRGPRQPDHRLASPLHHLDKADPLIWLITARTTIPAHATAFRQRMQQLGLQSDLTISRTPPTPSSADKCGSTK